MPNISEAPGPVVESLAVDETAPAEQVRAEAALGATRSSANWREMPGNWDRLNARALFPSGNEHGIPDLPLASHAPSRLTAYSDRRGCESAKPGDAAHFFLDDYRFETCWSQPERSLSRVARVGLALTPDFSLWREMPQVMQPWQVYRSRWCGAWWAMHGIDVIPTASWSTPDSYRYCFAGIATGSVVAVSSVGVMRDKEALRLFAAGVDAMVQAVEPSKIICYGAWPWAALGDPGLVDVVREYPTRWENR